MYYIYFSLSSILTFLLLRRRANKLWGTIGALSVWVVGGAAVYLLGPGVATLGPEDESPWWVEGVLFLLLLLGMSSKYLWDLIESRQEKNAKRPAGTPKFGLEFDFWDFVKPMLISAIVFAGITGMKYELSKMALIGSFQNGFFWQTVFKKKSSST